MATDHGGGRGRAVLVVDGERPELDITTRTLRQAGYLVHPADTYEEAIALAAAYDFDLLLTDSVMPRMSGPDLAARIEEIRPGRALVYMSGNSAGLLDHDRQPEAGRLLLKPFGRQALLDAVEHAMLDAAATRATSAMDTGD